MCRIFILMGSRKFGFRTVFLRIYRKTSYEWCKCWVELFFFRIRRRQSRKYCHSAHTVMNIVINLDWRELSFGKLFMYVSYHCLPRSNVRWRNKPKRRHRHLLRSAALSTGRKLRLAKGAGSRICKPSQCTTLFNTLNPVRYLPSGLISEKSKMSFHCYRQVKNFIQLR